MLFETNFDFVICSYVIWEPTVQSSKVFHDNFGGDQEMVSKHRKSILRNVYLIIYYR